jgi:hypothetical protein
MTYDEGDHVSRQAAQVQNNNYKQDKMTTSFECDRNE